MEFTTPSMFDENGFNVLSPTVQMMRAEGANPSAQSSFRYNGENPQQTAINNNMNPYMYNGYYQTQTPYAMVDNTNPPPGFVPMNQPNYGGNQSYNPYATMLQNNMGYSAAYSYQPHNRVYDPLTQPINPNVPGFYQQMVDDGSKAREMLQSAMRPVVNNIQNTQYQYYGTEPVIKYDYWGNPIGEYTYSEIKERNAPIYNQLYMNGVMNLSDYCSMNNGGISFTGIDGKTVRVGYDNGWYAGYNRIQQQKAMYEEQQKLYNENLQAWQMCANVARKCLEGEGMVQEAAELNLAAQQEHQQKLHKYHTDILSFDNWYDNMCAYVNTWNRSDKPGYVSPLVEKYVYNWNKLYDRRTKNYPEHYGVDEYFNKGIMTNQIIDDMAHDAELRERRVDLLFDQNKCRELFGQMFPSYDPVTGTSCAPVSMNVSDIEITLPENLKRERYLQRRQAFENTIFKDNTANIIQRHERM